jgi:hypothetical protein
MQPLTQSFCLGKCADAQTKRSDPLMYVYSPYHHWKSRNVLYFPVMLQTSHHQSSLTLIPRASTRLLPQKDIWRRREGGNLGQSRIHCVRNAPGNATLLSTTYLPPYYSPAFNPRELSFFSAMRMALISRLGLLGCVNQHLRLQAWIKWHFVSLRDLYPGFCGCQWFTVAAIAHCRIFGPRRVSRRRTI